MRRIEVTVNGERRERRRVGHHVRGPDDLPRPFGEGGGHAGAVSPGRASAAAYERSSSSMRW